jgi:hypothetical protein
MWPMETTYSLSEKSKKEPTDAMRTELGTTGQADRSNRNDPPQDDRITESRSRKNRNIAPRAPGASL